MSILWSSIIAVLADGTEKVWMMMWYPSGMGGALIGAIVLLLASILLGTDRRSSNFIITGVLSVISLLLVLPSCLLYFLPYLFLGLGKTDSLQAISFGEWQQTAELFRFAFRMGAGGTVFLLITAFIVVIVAWRQPQPQRLQPRVQPQPRADTPVIPTKKGGAVTPVQGSDSSITPVQKHGGAETPVQPSHNSDANK